MSTVQSLLIIDSKKNNMRQNKPFGHCVKKETTNQNTLKWSEIKFETKNQLSGHCENVIIQNVNNELFWDKME